MMKIEIKNRWTGEIILCGEYKSIKDCLEKNQEANLQGANLQGADLRGACLQGADLQGADLREAYLQGADLQEANLQGANLQGADLREADLRGANLREADLRESDLQGADLQGAKGINKYLTTPLYGMLDQENITAYKLVNSKNEGIYNGGLKYKVGKTITEKDVDTDEQNQCGKGINLATLNWCIRYWKKGYKILVCEFTKKDIACIPIASDGKFRVYKCKVIKEKKLKDIGLEEK